MNMKNGWVLGSDSLGLNSITTTHQLCDCITLGKFLIL